jgi:PAS domain-containing protein
VQVILSGEAPYQIVWASEAWLKLVGYPNDEACGKTLQLVEGPLTSQARPCCLFITPR